ncbi:MAG TPA: NAD-dependent epimerase/dehydratase family protein [Terriglobales bacterium]|nr:NAD-dependent epimerase/dehydratase family protein [Terriglobales bacterium]
MRVLILGGTGFIGAALARVMTRQGHVVGVFHRGRECEVDNGVHFHGDRVQLNACANRFADFAPEVVIDCIAGSAPAARQTLAIFGPLASRILLLSSMDVYRACGVFHGTELGALEPGLLHEASPLRRHPGLDPPSARARLRRIYGGLEEGYDKLGMERVVAAWPNSAQLTVVRLAPVYGPGDRQRRLYKYWRRMSDERPAILLPRGLAEWRSSRAFVGNVAEGVALAAVASRAAGRLYNLADRGDCSEVEWTQLVAQAWGWKGRLLITSPESTPAHLRVSARTAQSWCADTQRIRQELGYRDPVPVPDAIAATLAWERAHPPEDTETGAGFDYHAEDEALRRLGWTSRPTRPPRTRQPLPVAVPAAAPGGS